MSIPGDVLRLRNGTPICSGKGVLAVQTVKAALVAATGVVALVVSLPQALAGENDSLALTVSIDGAIGPAAASYVKDALATAAERRAEIVILRLNTPGGLTTSMREIIVDVLASPVPPLNGFVRIAKPIHGSKNSLVV
jgi:membrane-bound serine protease (ClpP class)